MRLDGLAGLGVGSFEKFVRRRWSREVMVSRLHKSDRS